ncbi:MAG: sigma-70 family RNA polymerase sigma factor [Flavisolibacter sp.]|nr:sigma-70 family RNA polymerase sigma factor [Flavisolibacter sp.]
MFFRYKKDICNVILHHVKNRLETEDLVQDAFLEINSAEPIFPFTLSCKNTNTGQAQ